MEDLANGLRDVLGATSIAGLVRLSGGASRETYRFDADGRALILQRQRGGYERDMAIEVAALRAAAAGGVPVPHVIAASTDPSALGASFTILTAVEGETIARKILRDERFATARAALAGQLGTAAARLHAVDPAGPVDFPVDDPLDGLRTTLDRSGEPHPAFELVFRWLQQHLPAPRPQVLVHGDYRLGNLIVGDDGLRAVIDWELAHLGNPMEDLGYLCVKAWRFGATLPVGGVGSYHQLFEAYEAAGGGPVDPAEVHWWEVLGTLKWGIICITQALAHTSGAARSHELAAIGRRVCENEHDLFLALEGHW
ncbi:MAG: phosphotransferase family protein [Actinomycetota bacterium]|nr:phosphotransferase family protein [Actinomycetota bacterium]